MANFFTILTLLAFLFTCGTDKNKAVLSIDKTVSVYFPPDINPGEFSLRFLITGSLGGYSGSVQTKLNVRDYEIPTSYEGKPAKTLKIIVYAPKYQTQVFDFPVLEEQKQRIEFEMKPLKTIPFYGQVILPDELNREEIQIQVNYMASWECKFFGLNDCLLAPMPITSTKLEENGKFEVDLPDIADDKVIHSLGENGSFSFSLKNKKTGNSISLKLKDNPKSFGEIEAASTYPDKNVFVLQSKK